MEELNNFVVNYSAIIGLLISIFMAFIPFYKYLNAKKLEQKHKNFENFHEKMIRKISNQDGEAGLDEQIAVVFDLRRFPEYYSLSRRILADLIKRLELKLEGEPYLQRLIDEADLTLQFINKKYFIRVFSKLFNKN